MIATIKKHRLAIIISGFLLLILGYIGFISKSSIGGSDEFMHYRIAHFAFKHPELYLHHWGKPFFTLFASPFAVFGMGYMHLFNVLMALAGSILVYLICYPIAKNNGLWVFALCFLSPVYYSVVPSSLTEVFFSTWWLLCIYLYIHNLKAQSILCLSFILFIRNEGFLVFIPFFLQLALDRKLKLIPLAFVSIAIYSILGFFHFNDILWLKHQFPYASGTSPYGKGSFWHYAGNYEEIFGNSLFTLIAVLGILSHGFQSVKQYFISKGNLVTPTFILGTLGAIIYFLGHSYSWWSGKGSSAGLLRTIAPIIPIISMSSILLINSIMNNLRSIKPIYAQVVTVLLLMSLAFSFRDTQLVSPLSQMEQTIDGSWKLFEKKYRGEKIACLAPYLIHASGKDPYDKVSTYFYFGMPQPDREKIGIGDILFWESHHSPSEGALQLDTMFNQKDFKLVGYYQPDYYFEMKKGIPYEVCFFKRMAKPCKTSNYRIKDSLISFYDRQSRIAIVDSIVSIKLMPNEKRALNEFTCDGFDGKNRYTLLVGLNTRDTSQVKNLNINYLDPFYGNLSTRNAKDHFWKVQSIRCRIMPALSVCNGQKYQVSIENTSSDTIEISDVKLTIQDRLIN